MVGWSWSASEVKIIGTSRVNIGAMYSTSACEVICSEGRYIVVSPCRIAIVVIQCLIVCLLVCLFVLFVCFFVCRACFDRAYGRSFTGKFIIIVI